LEETHTISFVPKRERNLEVVSLVEIDDLELNTTNMEIYEANNTPTWIVVQLAKSNLIAEELS
jgi:hypothetical protein